MPEAKPRDLMWAASRLEHAGVPEGLFDPCGVLGVQDEVLRMREAPRPGLLLLLGVCLCRQAELEDELPRARRIRVHVDGLQGSRGGGGGGEVGQFVRV